MSKRDPGKDTGLAPRPGYPPTAPDRARRSGRGGEDGNGESSKSTRKSITTHLSTSKQQRSGTDRQPRPDIGQPGDSTADDRDVGRRGSFAEGNKGKSRLGEDDVQMPTERMNVGRHRSKSAQQSSRAIKPCYPTVKPPDPKIATGGLQENNNKKTRRSTITAEPIACEDHTPDGHDRVEARHEKGYVQKRKQPRHVQKLEKLEQSQKTNKLQEPKNVHELKDPGKMTRSEEPRNVPILEPPGKVHGFEGRRTVQKPEETGVVLEFGVPEHSHNSKELHRPHLQDTKRTAMPLPVALPKPEVIAPPLPTRNPRRSSFSTDGGRSLSVSSMFNSSREEPPPRSANRSTSCTPTQSLYTYSDDGRTSDRTSRSFFPDEISRGRDRGRDNAPPVSLGRFARDRPRVGTISPGGQTARGSLESLRCIRNDVMANYLYQQATQKSLLVSGQSWQGVVLKRARGDYACCPPQLAEIKNGLYSAVLKMNIRCAMTVDTHVTQTILKSMVFAGFNYAPLPNGLRVQMVPTMHHLPLSQLQHFAAFVADLEILVVWDDDPENLLARAEDLQHKFVQLLWTQGQAKDDVTGQGHSNGAAPASGESQPVDSWNMEAAAEPPRRPKLNSAFITSCTLLISFVCLGTGWRNLTLEVKTDGKFSRLALLATIPMQLFTCQFFFQALIGNICQIFGPISQMKQNSKCYSGRAPSRRLRRGHDRLPHLTIQMPVYKEGLHNVIRPTVLSIKAAISTYGMQGGTASIFINDDGMQLISREAAQERRDFYDENQIGWVARPGHGSVVGSESGQRPFNRRGKFKKASNMNFCLNVSNKIEERLSQVDRHTDWTQKHENRAYKKALTAVLAEDEGRTWADGNIRVGDYILIVDSDTRIPRDCILDAMSEMEQSPHVAILQFSAGILNVTDSFFEKGVSWFTDMIYTAITYAVAGGDSTPFVGHNAIVRWKAIQSAAGYYEPQDGYEKYWSEDHVSEDFAMALSLLTAGYQLRYAAYQGDGFKEGVSLTVYDELARWEKYAYGVNEVMFHPFRKWITRGPFTPLFRRFLGAKRIPITHKLTILAYLGTYYAIASAFPLSAMNYFLTGWEYGMYDKFYRDSFSVFFSIIVVFTALGNVALAALRYRLKKGGLIENLKKNLKWAPFFTIFLGGLSLHLSQSILCHAFEIDMSWGATAKEAEDVVFGKEVVRILKKFKGTFFICLLSIGVMVYMAAFAPYNWRIAEFSCIFPVAILVVCHLLLPLALSPALMRMSW